MNPQSPVDYQSTRPVQSSKGLYIVLASVAFVVIGVAIGVMAVLGVFSSHATSQTGTATATSSARVSPTGKFLQLAHTDKLPAADDTMVQAALDFCSSMPFATGNDAQIYFDQLVFAGGMETNANAHAFEYDSASAFCPDKMNDLSGP